MCAHKRNPDTHTHTPRTKKRRRVVIFFLFICWRVHNAFQYHVEYEVEAAEWSCVWVWVRVSVCIVLCSKVTAIKIWSFENATRKLMWACHVKVFVCWCVCVQLYHMCQFLYIFFRLWLACLVLLLMLLMLVLFILLHSLTNGTLFGCLSMKSRNNRHIKRFFRTHTHKTEMGP